MRSHWTPNPGGIKSGPDHWLPEAAAGPGQRAVWWRRSRDVPATLWTGAADERRSPKMARLEAALFVADGALSARRLAQRATLAGAAEARGLVQRLNLAYDRCGSAFRIEDVAGGYRLLTRPELALWLDRLHQRRRSIRLSPPALETLTVIAYRQPVTRADVEAVRGVQCTEIIKQLMDRGLVRITGAEDTLGRPYLYETTSRFLEMFGLRSLDDLPGADHLRKQAGS